jgi:kynurenine 3-monooxygenase
VTQVTESTASPASAITVIGAGLAGTLLALLLARRGQQVVVYERRGDPRASHVAAGRSINLALTDRGLHALEVAGAREAVQPLVVPMRGRMLHDELGSQTFVPYGQRPHEVIYSVSRLGLNRILLDCLEANPNASVHFQHACTGIDQERGLLVLEDNERRLLTRPLRHVVGADGAGSMLRRALARAYDIGVQEDMLTHGYKELTIPALPGARAQLDPHALHIWPRGGFMLIALANIDGTFTATLFLAHEGETSFAKLVDAAAVEAFFQSHFSDAYALMPDLATEFFAHPTGSMGTLQCDRWAVGEQAVLIGDAAHAILPFHGQGMNCAFEDCVELDSLLTEHDWRTASATFEYRRRPNTHAIATMAQENYLEMRDTVRHPKYQLEHALALALERRCPTRFIPRYSMVSFHHEIPYAVAQARGRTQSRLLREICAQADTLADIDLDAATLRVEHELSPITTR